MSLGKLRFLLQGHYLALKAAYFQEKSRDLGKLRGGGVPAPTAQGLISAWTTEAANSLSLYVSSLLEAPPWGGSHEPLS